MYVTPAPDADNDPLYAVRFGLTGMLGYAAVAVFNPVLPAVMAAMPLAIIAGQRKAFNPVAAIAGPVVLIAMAFVTAWMVEQLLPMPLVLIGAMWLCFFLGFRMILKTGSPVGMIVVVLPLLMSIMGMNGTMALDAMRLALVQAALLTLVLGPVVYMLLPPRTQERHVAVPAPGVGQVEIGAAIRATVLLALSFWLYSVMQPSDLMMALIAAMVIVFPSRLRVWDEAFQRIRATLYGAAMALLLLAFFMVSARLPIILGLIFLSGLFLGTKMMQGKRPSMVYQYAFSVTLALVAGALSTQDPAYASFTRIILTLLGAFTAAFAVALLDDLTGWHGDQPENEGATQEAA
ncbi:FUSC family protein [Roseobacter denitrificans]|nr:FUSC family protein [Roseobacter denitrificans]AVL52444.1 FUSC family protein [Roseobacter denitrificans]SFG08462.1 Fusaric acid resistance protein-like [Roseobacter denitrificans OCh 114]